MFGLYDARRVVAKEIPGSRFIETNKRNPSKNDEDRGKLLNWLRHNRQSFAAREMNEERIGV